MRLDTKARICVISHARPDAVAKMQAMFEDNQLYWYVGKGEAKLYEAAGATFVQESGKLIPSRNKALEDSFARGMYCLQVSDDMKSVKIALSKKTKRDTTASKAGLELIKILEKGKDTHLAGVSPTANPFYTNPKQPIRSQHFIVGDFIVVKPTELRFDENMTLKEDYDYTLQHIQKYGIVVRLDVLLIEFMHRTNVGGAVQYRTSEAEQYNIKYLQSKWGNAITINGKKPDEIILRTAALGKTNG